MSRQLVLGSLVIALLAGCATSRISSKYRDPEFQGPIRSVMIVGITPSETGRAAFETEFARRFQALGVRAVPGRKLIAETRGLTERAMRTVVRSEGLQAVLVVRMVDINRESQYVPPTIGFYRPYYSPFYYTYVYSPGFVATNTRVFMEITLHDVNRDRLIWSGVSEHNNPRQASDIIEELANTVIEEFTHAGLI